MINTAIGHVLVELNSYFGLQSGHEAESVVVAGSLFDLDGNVNTATKNKVVLSMVNIEQDSVYREVEAFKQTEGGKGQRIKPKINVNLYLLFVANLAIYTEAMKSIANVVSFFQINPSFDYADFVGTEGPKGRMSFDLFSMTFEQQNNLWSVLGAKYMPSVVYKVGMLEIKDQQIESEVPPVQELWVEGSKR
ncbi:MAG: DUF4255 domain-containing protein [Gammaproteobacteria bacterium]|nr:DUF4255 domain-containing protein [Gammaproteobacteria bacterium]